MDQTLATFARLIVERPEAVWYAAAAILLVALLFYLFWFRPHVRAMAVALGALGAVLRQGVPEGWEATKQRVAKTLEQHPILKEPWRETGERVLVLSSEPRPMLAMLGSPRDIWTARRLLGGRLNLSLAEAVPNLLVGVGLLLTFFFLTAALTLATVALGADGATNPVKATEELLRTAGAKFMTSLAGLLASICWTIAAKRALMAVSTASDTVLDQLGRIVPPVGGEMALFSQLQSLRGVQASSSETAENTKAIAALFEDSVGVSEELLNEAREQTGALKRFETDLAVSLAGAITSAFSPQMEEMTSRLVGAIETLSDRISTMNQDALQKMLEDFAGMLKQTTDSEMRSLQETLAALAKSLEQAGVALGEGTGRVAATLNRAGERLAEQIDQVAENLANGAKNLEVAAEEVKLAMNDLDVTINDAADLGKKGNRAFEAALMAANNSIGSLTSVAGGIAEAVASVEAVTGRIADVVDSIEELTSEQRSVVREVRAATPEALASIEKVTAILKASIAQTEGAMNQTRMSLDSTSKQLGATVASITEGVGTYTEQVADLHRSMDEYLARAVGSVEKGVVSLEEAIEELNETLSERAVAGVR